MDPRDVITKGLSTKGELRKGLKSLPMRAGKHIGRAAGRVLRTIRGKVERKASSAIESYRNRKKFDTAVKSIKVKIGGFIRNAEKKLKG